MKTIKLVCALISLNRACLTVVDPLSGLIVDSAAASPGDGSQCFPFSSLSEAFAASDKLSNVTFLLSSRSDILTGPIQTEVRIVGAPTALIVPGQIIVRGVLELTMVVIKEEGGDNWLFLCNGESLKIAHSEVYVGNNTIVEILKGTVEVTDTHIHDLESPVFVIRNTSATLSLIRSNFTDIEDLVVIVPSDKQDAGAMLMIDVRLTRLWRIVNYPETAGGQFRISLHNCTITGAQHELFLGNLAHLIIDARNVSMVDSQSFVLGRLINSSVSLDGCSFLRLGSPLLDLSALQGELILLRSYVSDMSRGPLVLMPTNSYPAAEAIVIISDCIISNVTNVGDSGQCSVMLGVSVTFSLLNTEIFGGETLDCGLFKVYSGVAKVTNVYYHDSAARSISLFEGIGLYLNLTDVVMRRVANADVMMSACILGSECHLTNLTIVDSINTYDNFRAFALFAVGYNTIGSVRESYFRNSGLTLVYMGANDEARLCVSNSTFVDLNGVITFSALKESFVGFDNVTFVRPRNNVFFRGFYCTNCFNFSQIRIEGEAEIDTLLWVDYGVVTLSDSVFQGIGSSLFRISNTNLTVTNVNFTESTGRICGECIASNIEFIRFGLESIHSPQPFEMTYSSVILREWRVKDVTCEQLMQIDQCEVSVFGGVLEKMKVDSFGGLITAASSSILLSSVSMMDVQCTLSINMGILSLEDSSLSILHSRFSDFNSTLISAVRSPVSIKESEFFTGGLIYRLETRRVLVNGSVLFASLSPSVSISNCQFYNLSADNGGALYLSGSGTEVCTIVNTTATGNTAMQDGGFLYATQVAVVLRDCSFSSNAAVNGGALLVSGTNGELLIQLASTRFVSNSARLRGGAMLHLHCGYQDEYCGWVNNTAEYGPSIASELTSFSVLDNVTMQPVDNYTVWAVSGQQYRDEIWMGCIDALNQVIRTDNYSVLELSTAEPNSSIAVPVLLQAVRGVFVLPSFIVMGKPGTQVSVIGSLSSSFKHQVFGVSLRECVSGEHFSDMQCKLCTHNTYSFVPSNPCLLCPSQADCLTGDEIALHPGFWRSSTSTADILACLLPELCTGGFKSECRSGHQGMLCNECSEGYFKVSQLQCTSCVGKAFAVFKGFISLTLAATTGAYVVWRGGVMMHLVVFDYFQSIRILANFSILWPSSLAYTYSILGDFGSSGLTAFTDMCLGALSGLESAYSQVIISMLYFSLLLTPIPCLFFLRKLRMVRMEVLKMGQLVLYLSYLMLPMLFMRVTAMFPCVQIDTENFLVYDPSVECWSRRHAAFSFAAGVPVYVLTALVPMLLLVGRARFLKRFEHWQRISLSILLLRKCALIGCLMPPNSLNPATQVCGVLLMNIATEIGLKSLNKDTNFLSMYQSTLISTSLLSFACVIYWASNSSVADKSSIFFVVNYACLLLPAANALLLCRRDRRVVAYMEAANPATLEINASQDPSIGMEMNSQVAAVHRGDSL